ncbi:MAG: DEAD/DEAH box helicase [Sarcina sp.]
MNFLELGINEELAKRLIKSGIKTPTKIQEDSIPHILAGNDLIGEAKTGTGKTLAFLLPTIQNIDEDSKHTQVLVISPTRELALQITDGAKNLTKGTHIRALAAYGGKDVSSQANKLKHAAIHIVIATPGRLLDHIERRTIDLSKIKTVIIDEADQMLLMGFRNEITEIMKHVPKKAQTLCFSATMDSAVKKLAYRYMNNPVEVKVEEETLVVDKIRQEIVETTDRWKQDALCTVLEEDNPFMAIIFCRTKRRADELEAGFAKRKIACEKIHSDVSQAKREKIMKQFRKCNIQYLIATDVASRGIDISGVTHIYNYDVPETVESYVHRIGRTGRAGDEGYACMFTDPKNLPMIKQIEEALEIEIDRRHVDIKKTQ